MESVDFEELATLRSALNDALESTAQTVSALLRMRIRNSSQESRLAELREKEKKYSSMLRQLNYAADNFSNLAAA